MSMPAKEHLAAIALGSNLGDREATLREAALRLGTLGRVLAVSRFHDTAPVGLVEQPRFLNAALLLKTELGPEDLLRKMLALEQEMGRRRDLVADKGPRTLDLDLLLYGDAVLELPGLSLPHPEMHRRRFVLEPLAEISPEWRHPVLGRTVRQLLEEIPRE